MQKKIIAVDLDGTALNKNEQLSHKTINILRKASQAGHIVSIITGRPYRISSKYYKQLGIPNPIINFNGAWGHIPNHHWGKEYNKTFTKDIPLTILEKRKELGIQVVAAETKDNVYANRPDDVLAGFFPSKLRPDQALNAANLKEEPTSTTLLVKKGQLAQTAKKLKLLFGDEVSVGVWGGPNPILELAPAGIDKAWGLEFLAEAFDVSIKDTVAFGDEHNDAVILKEAGLGVAMKNATEKIKSIADDITEYDNNHNGMADYLAKLLNLN